MKLKPAILVIGGTGFIGTYVVKALIKNGKPVVATYRDQLDKNRTIMGVFYYQKLDLEPKLIEGIKTVIYTPRPDPVALSETFDFLRRLPKLNKIVYLSTFGLYPDSLEKQKETAEIVPISKYQKEKYAEEAAFTDFAKNKKIKLCLARISNPYGDVYDKQFIGRVIKEFLYEKGDFKINGDGNQLKDFIFIEDAAELISFLAARDQKSGCEIFNVCSGSGHSINEVIAVLENLSGKKLVFKHVALPEDEKVNSIGDNTKILRASGYKIRYHFDKGLAKTLDNYTKYDPKYF